MFLAHITDHIRLRRLTKSLYTRCFRTIGIDCRPRQLYTSNSLAIFAKRILSTSILLYLYESLKQLCNIFKKKLRLRSFSGTF